MINIGFIGLGSMARNHLERLKEIPEARVVAGTAPSSDRRREVAAKYGLRDYSDYKEMLEREKLDAVYVCLPPFAHTGHEQEIVSRDIAIFVEKPVCLQIPYATQTANAIHASGIINSVGYMCRYLDVVAEAKRIIGEAPIVAMRGFYFAPIPRLSWWPHKEFSGGQIVEQATHVVDLMRYFAGEVVKVSAEGYRGAITNVEGYDLEDAASVNFRFANGAIANLMTTCVMSNQFSPGLEILTPGQRIWLDLPPRPVKLRRLDGLEEEINCQHDRFIKENEAFVKAVMTKDQSLIQSDYADAVETLALTLASQAAVEKAMDEADDGR